MEKQWREECALGEIFDGNCPGKLPTLKPLSSCCCHPGQCSMNNRRPHKQKKYPAMSFFGKSLRKECRSSALSCECSVCVSHQSAALKEVKKG